MQASASPEQFTTFIASDIPRSAKAMREAGLVPESLSIHSRAKRRQIAATATPA